MGLQPGAWHPVHDVDVSQLDVKVTGPGNVMHTAAYGSTGKSSIELRLTGPLVKGGAKTCNSISERWSERLNKTVNLRALQ